MIQTVTREGRTLAIVLRAEYQAEGIKFFTPDDFSQQLAYMNRPAGKLVPPAPREQPGLSDASESREGRHNADGLDDKNQ